MEWHACPPLLAFDKVANYARVTGQRNRHWYESEMFPLLAALGAMAAVAL